MKNELSSTSAYTAVNLTEKDIINRHVSDLGQYRAVVTEKQSKLPSMYWLPKLHKSPYKARFIANSSTCTTTNISILLTSCLTAVKEHIVRYCNKTYENSGINLFWSIKNSGEVLQKIHNKRFHATSFSTYDFSTLYTTLPHNLIKDRLIPLIKKTFAREESYFLACNKEKAFFTNENFDHYTMWTCAEVCAALTFLLDNIYVCFNDTVYRQVVGIPMGTNCAPLVADLFLYCYERDFMLSLSPTTDREVIDAFNHTSRYLDDIFNIDNPFFESKIASIYPKELKLIKANNSDTVASFLDLHLSIINGVIHTKIYDKRDDFDFDIVNYPHLDGDVPRATSYGVYISQLNRFARACSAVGDFNYRNRVITAKLLGQGFRYHKLRRTFTKFYRKNNTLLEKYHTSLKVLLKEGISQPSFYGDVVYKLRRISGLVDFSNRFTKLIGKYVGKGYDPLILQCTACLVIDPFTVNNHASLFGGTTTRQN